MSAPRRTLQLWVVAALCALGFGLWLAQVSGAEIPRFVAQAAVLAALDWRDLGGYGVTYPVRSQLIDALAKAEDPSRATALATCCERDLGPNSGVPITATAADLGGANRYVGWYYGVPGDLGPHLDELHAMKRGVPLVASGKITMTIGAMCVIGPACIGLAGSPGVAIVLFRIGGVAHQRLSGALVTLCSGMVDSRTVGTATGMAGTSARVGGMLFALLIGPRADAWGYAPLFAALAAFDLVPALVLWSLLRGTPRTVSRV